MSRESSDSAGFWAMAGGGGGRAGRFPRPVNLDPEPWRRLQTAGAVQASVVFDAQERAFVADMAGCVQAFTPGREVLWRQQLEGGISATPAVDLEGSRIFIGTQAGWVYALGCADGNVVWRQRLPSKSDSRIVSDLLYVPARDSVVLSSWGGLFYSLAGASGETRHTWDAGVSPRSGAAADRDGNIYCLRAVRGEGVCFVRVAPTGEERVLHQEPETQRGAKRAVVAAAPVLDEGRGVAWFVTNGDRESKLHGWLVREERLLSSHPLPHVVVGTPALGAGGALILADLSGSVRAIAPDGSRAFRYSTIAEYLLAGAVCDSNGRIFLGDPLGFLHVIDAAGTGEPVFEAARSIQARPAFDHSGNLYLAATDRTVYVFRNKA